jgi:ribonuclease HI
MTNENPKTEKQIPTVKQIPTTPDTNYEHEILWHLEFDGSVNKLGAGAGVWVYNLENDHAEGHAYRLNFKCTNNMAEYEALLLGLKLVKRLGAIRVSVIGDSELIIKQIKGKYLTRDPRLGYYRGTVIEILNTFLETQLATIPRKHNMQAHSLAMFASTCKLPFQPNHQYTAEIRHRPAIPDNLKNWQVFDSDEQINNFLTLDEEFSNS